MDMTLLPLVTVVTETYRNFDYLEDNIKSVLRQTYAPIEYIIADDGSGNFPLDRVKQIIKDNKRDNIVEVKFLISKENKGTVKNEGDAYRSASGYILMPLAGDDEFYDENVVSNVVNTFKQTGCEALSVSRVAVKENKKFAYYLPHIRDYKKIYSIDTPIKKYYSLVTGKFYNMASGSTLYIKKDLFERLGGYDQRFILWEDSPFLLKMFSSGINVETAYDIKGIYYRLGGVSTGNVNPKYLEDKRLYNSILAKEHYSSLPGSVKRFVDHNSKSAQCKTTKDRIFLYLQDWTIMLRKIWYRYNDKMGEFIDALSRKFILTK